MEAVVLLAYIPEQREVVVQASTPKKRRRNKKHFFKHRKRWYLKPAVAITKEPLEDFQGFDDKERDFPFQVTSQSMSPRAPELTFQVVPIKKRRIRVLSLFDGISTAVYILEEKLNLDIEIFFSSEIEQKAIRIQKERWDGKIVQLGDVKKNDQTLLHSLRRIDLVLGGSPCDEVSLVNWRGRGLNDPESSGHLFYNFKTIKEFFVEKRMNEQGLPFFWLFENTNKMRCSMKEEISKHLHVQPVLICASQLLPMLRMKYFWGNIPNMENFGKRMLTSLSCCKT
ncbi:DNA (cytosine-5)-methyltransferase 3A [Frankliniella fusca]|uniref:DNA (cytosine-5-)-methyltransferase n=1 Tax=Frankliniella fusca TaxID=407009 RepID=A0AAE1GX05_9NEOP|nr:DNA (cytosine-5)-methyltransferase 3A [Frankliniella fusca]